MGARTPTKRDTRDQTGLGGLRLGRILGVEVWLDWSLLIVFALVTLGLAGQLLPTWHPEWSRQLRWLVAIVAALAFFASVLAHELAHALVARWQGMTVRRITLFLFGGMAHLEDQPPTPQAELLMAVVGPLASIAIGIGSLLLAGLVVDPTVVASMTRAPEIVPRMLGPIETVLLWLGPINLMLGLFNLVPGFPLDGGRVLRALAWWASGDIKKATRLASGSGKLVALSLVLLGVAMAIGVRVPYFGTGLGSGLWLVLIGWFLYGAARASYTQLLAHEALTGVSVAQLMRRRFDAVAPELSVADFIQEHVMHGDQETFPVVSGLMVAGMVSARAALALPPEQWPVTPVRAIMTPADELATVAPDRDVRDALPRLETRGQLAVIDHGELRGILHGQDVLKWLRFQSGEPLGAAR